MRFLLLLFIAGCAKSPLIPSEIAINNRQVQLEKLGAWQIKGRLALTTAGKNWTIKLHWLQDQEDYLIRLTTLLNQGTHVIRGKADGACLTDQNKTICAADADNLLKQTLDWHISLPSLTHWIRGLPEPGATIKNQLFDDQGRITQMQQTDWQIDILRYTDVDGIDLPSKIHIQNNHLKLKLVIQAWALKH